MKVKVCGLTDPNNIIEVAELKPDYVGFIFYPGSPRYMDKDPGSIPETDAQRVGIFVNECIETIIKTARNFRLSIIQLHGDEDPEMCSDLQELGYKVAKAIKIDDKTIPDEVETYASVVDFFVFDTKGKIVGGTGQKFNWKKLDELAEFGPFLLSGGIGPDDAEIIRKLNYPNLVGVDINSRFEDEPGMKNIELLKRFFDELNLVPV